MREKMDKYTNIFYCNPAAIGGIETFIYYIAQKYKEYDITVVYRYADEKQLKRLKKYVRCVRYNNQKIKCKKAFFNYNIDIIDNIEAEEYYQIIHGDYNAVNIPYKTDKRITKYLGVSKLVCNSFEKATGIKAELIYNPLKIEESQRILKLISATRLTPEKGAERIKKLANKLNEDNIPFEWQIFTNSNINFEIENVIIRKPKLNIINNMANADYLVQLSDTEGYCYSMVEALSVKTPVICTNMPVIKEIGINNENAYVLDMNMGNIDTEKIYNNIPIVKDYKAPKCSLINYLDKTKNKYEEEKKMKYKVEALDTYKKNNIEDAELKRIPEEGETFEVSKERLETLTGNNYYNIAFVKVLEEIKENEVEEIIEDEVETSEEDIVDEKEIKENEVIEVKVDKVNVTKKSTTRKKK